MSAKRKRVSVQIRVPEDLHSRWSVADAERDVAMNFLAVRAISEFLDDLVPADGLRFTYDRERSVE